MNLVIACELKIPRLEFPAKLSFSKALNPANTSVNDSRRWSLRIFAGSDTLVEADAPIAPKCKTRKESLRRGDISDPNKVVRNCTVNGVDVMESFSRAQLLKSLLKRAVGCRIGVK